MLTTWVTFLSLRARFKDRARRAMGDEMGSTVAEYALVLVLVSVAVITVLNTLGGALTTKIGEVVTKIQSATP